MTAEQIFKMIGELADSLSMEVYVIGGYVRDRFLNKESHDIDFVVLGDAPEFAKKLADFWKVDTLVVYENFGTAMIPYHGYILEFVTARAESYRVESRNPIVQKADLKTDVLRRDFTVNTLAFGLNKDNFGQLVDLLDGRKDLEAKILRTPLDPVQTFYDDPLRIMRVIRFSAQLGFSIDPSVYQAVFQVVDRLEIISVERISEEFFKLMGAAQPSIGLHLLKETGILKVILPELDRLDIQDYEEHGSHHKNVWEHTLKVLDRVAEQSGDLALRLAALFHDVGKFPTREFREGKGWTFYNHELVGSKMIPAIFKRMRWPKDLGQKVKKLVYLHMRPIALTEEQVTDSAIRRLIVKADEDLDDLLLLTSSDLTSANPKRVAEKKEKFQFILRRLQEVREKDQLRAFQSPVRGDEIMALANLQPGKQVGYYKHLIEEAILEGVIPNEYEAAKEYLINLLKNGKIEE
ncbi:MAG TPA: CCA tRNA nucleotidyltransferase [bacterium]|nr:CCA tRNA nucleotidyltransferase [bacterium]